MDETAIEVYSWNPNFFQAKSHEAGGYTGNVIGNRSKEDQILMVTEAGAEKKKVILEESRQLISEINARAQKLIDIMAISKDTMSEIVSFFGDDAS